MRTPLVAGNWKMNPPSLQNALELAAGVRAVAEAAPGATAVVCPPAIWLSAVANELRDGPVRVGAQTMHPDERGAFTGEISPLMLVGLAEYVIIGHSERRQYDCETDEKVAAKVASAVGHGLRPIMAIGERADERRAGSTGAVIDRQLRAGLSNLDRLAGSRLVLAYEPVWAIGTGEAASPADAQTVAAQIRAVLHELDPDAASEIPVLYGGSVTPENAAVFFEQPEIDGALVGGSCLDAGAFGAILQLAARSAH
ncbi:MAG: triose-phosphate isomerase [Chloroflexota bacterium]|nr:triose-phosphate isomerase [Chloroflexota bacterium]